MRRNSPIRLLLSLAIILVTAASSALAAVQDRIAATISNSARTTIPDSVHGKALKANDLGPAAAAMKMEGMTLRFNMTAAQTAALDQLLLDQQNPSSPRYHQWLTPATYAAQFGLSSADIAQVTAWLGSQGFTVTEVAQSGTFVRFNGTAAQVDAAFATSIHSLSVNGETHFANVTDASLPTALAAVVTGITGLHDFKLKARIRAHAALMPDYTASGNHYVIPGDFYQIYNELPLFTSSITGAGQTIAVMGQVDLYNTGTAASPNYADIAAFRSASGLSANVPIVKTYGTDPGSPTCQTNCFPNEGDLAESSLDVEWSGATAPGASVIFVNSTDVINYSLTDAIDNNLAPIVSISYGDCEPSWGTTDLNTYNALLKMGNSFGITIVAPAGDDGATDCDDEVSSAVQGLAVDFPASSPYATAMGGTMFNEGSGSYWGSSQSTFTAGASSPVLAAPYSAVSYIPEAAWSDIASGYFGGSGGGPSAFFTKPYWQVGTGVPADASRDIPDLALDASDVHDGLLYCVSNSCSGGFTTTIAAEDIAGGTSFAAPSFAGILALIEQKIGARIGNANPVIYALANNSAYYVAGSTSAASSKLVFNDVTTGNNNSPCTAGSPYCNASGSIGYAAGAGYDLATGWGSVNANALVNSWSLVTPIAVSGPAGTNVSTTVAAVSASSVAAGTSVTLTATVTGSAGATPTGTAQFLVNNVEVGAPVALTNGAATYSLATSCAAIGKLIVEASYSGDSLYAGSKGSGITSIGFTTTANSVVTPVSVTVTSGSCPSFNLTGPTSAISVAANGTPVATISVAPVNGFTGTVTFSASSVSNTNFTPGFTFSPASVSITGTTAASTTITLTGVTADLRMPVMPGVHSPDTTLAQQSHPRSPWYAAGSGVTMAALLLFVLPRRRRLGGLLVLVLSVATLCGITGCSSSNSTIAASIGTNYAGTYLVTVVGTYTSGATVISQSTTVTFVIQ
jgi:subtilase family serine protease